MNEKDGCRLYGWMVKGALDGPSMRIGIELVIIHEMRSLPMEDIVAHRFTLRSPLLFRRT